MPSKSYTQILERIHAALAASRLVFARFTPGEIETEYKAGHDPVTEADRALDAVLRKELLREGEGWLSEESVDDPIRLQSSRVWVVDPLDGTREFVKGIPEFCVSIGFVENGHPVAGGIYNPATDETFLGSVDSGVTYNGRPSQPSQRNSLEGALVLASRSEVKRGEWKPFENAAFKIRPMGSVAYKLALVAAGLADVTFTLTPKNEWDVAAGAALVLSGGGFVGTLENLPLRCNNKNPLLSGLLASGPHLREQLLTVVSEHADPAILKPAEEASSLRGGASHPDPNTMDKPVSETKGTSAVDPALPTDSFYIIGGRVRSTVFRKLQEWQSCEQALLVELNPATNQSRARVEYVSPPEVCSDELPAILFKSATLQGNTLYTCTSTEVLVYEIPSFRLLHYVSLPCFNDLHHVSPSQRGTILVASTGLDMVVEVTTAGDLVRQWNVLGEDPWARFSQQTDYRKVPTTKPHHSHPNHVFEIDQEVWVTRFKQRDAICLTTPGPRIEIPGQGPHDGYVVGDRIYFTTVDGQIVIANRKTPQVEVIDLNQMSGQPGQPLGWCRGMLPIGERWLWVGFTRVRSTKLAENVAWIRNGYSHRHKPSHLALYDLERKTCVREIELEPHGVEVVFTLLPVPALSKSE